MTRQEIILEEAAKCSQGWTDVNKITEASCMKAGFLLGVRWCQKDVANKFAEYIYEHRPNLSEMQTKEVEKLFLDLFKF